MKFSNIPISICVKIGLLCCLSCHKQPILLNQEKPEVTIAPGDPRLLLDDLRLSSDTVYILATHIVRNAGQLLTIEPGTLIKVNDLLSIVINKGASINAKGERNKPIVFTSSASKGGAGLQCGVCTSNHIWTGIIVNGNAGAETPYRSSGELSYVRVEFAGGTYDAAALTLNNVDAQTMIDHVQVSYSTFSSSVELNGGNVNLSHIISYASNTNDYFLHGGYQGMMQYVLAYRHPFFPLTTNGTSGNTLAGLYITGDGDSATSPVISNATVLGPDSRPGTSADYFLDPPIRRAALITTGAARFHIRNSIFMGFPKTAFYIDDHSTARALHFDESEFNHNIVHSNDSARAFYLQPGVYLPFESYDFGSYMQQPRFSNKFFLKSNQFQFANAFDYDGHPDVAPLIGSPVLTGASFDSTLYTNNFFVRENFVGATGTENWMNGWTNFTPLQTTYNAR